MNKPDKASVLRLCYAAHMTRPVNASMPSLKNPQSQPDRVEAPGQVSQPPSKRGVDIQNGGFRYPANIYKTSNPEPPHIGLVQDSDNSRRSFAPASPPPLAAVFFFLRRFAGYWNYLQNPLFLMHTR